MVRAQSQQDKWNKCPGAATATVQVVGPQINSLVPFSAVTPGGGLILVGENFGYLTGAILIHLTDYLGHPLDRALQNLQWGDLFAAGTIPGDISGVLDQQATLTVVAQCGAVSNPWTAHFTAAPDVADLALFYDAPGSFSCSMSTGSTDHTHVKIKDAAIFRRNADAARTGHLVGGSRQLCGLSRFRLGYSGQRRQRSVLADCTLATRLGSRLRPLPR